MAQAATLTIAQAFNLAFQVVLNQDGGEDPYVHFCLLVDDKYHLQCWPGPSAYLILVTTATTGGSVPFSSRRTFFH